MPENADSDETDDNEQEEYNVTNHEPLKQFAKAQTPELYKGSEEMHASDEAIDLLERQLQQVAKHVWIKAAKKREMQGKRSVQPEQIRESFNEYMHPQNLLKEVSNELQRMRWQFQDLAEQSPMIESPEYPEDDE